MLHSSARELLKQLENVIQTCRDEDFDRPLKVLSGATIGQHIRHTLEFFICLFDAKKDGTVNYDERKHDHLIETDRKLAVSVIGSILSFLEENPEDFDLMLEANYTMKEVAGLNMKSSFYRELAYNIEHIIHHMALLKVAVVQDLTYIQLPEHFGIASSTIRYRYTSKSH